MAPKKKIPVRELVVDIANETMADSEVMEKYSLNSREFIFVIGKLAEKRKISFKRVVSVIRGFLENNEVIAAEESLGVVRRYFGEAWGVQSIVKGLEHELVESKSKLEFQHDMEKVSRSLSWFEYEFPGAPIHPSVVSSVKFFEKLSRILVDNATSDFGPKSSFDARPRLMLYPPFIHLFERYEAEEAVRMWHFLAVKLFFKNKVESFMIKGMMDSATCDVCMHLDGTVMPVAEVYEAARARTVPGEIFYGKRYPALVNVEDLPRDQRPGALIQNGWYLPPFCEHCRCQIFPCL